MTSPALLYLATDQFSDQAGFVLPPGPMRRRLLRDSHVQMLESMLRYDLVTASEIREFVSALMVDSRPGEIFRHDIALAALAVAMEHWRRPFAEEYLRDLAGTRRAEFRCSFRVALECLEVRKSFPHTQVRTAPYASGMTALATASGVPRVMSARPSLAPEPDVPWVRYPEVAHAST